MNPERKDFPMGQQILDLFKQSVIVQGILTLAVVGVWLYMLASGMAIPETLTNIVGLVFGFFFGGKYALAMAKMNGGG
jgi:hypothetical protein